MTPSTMAARRSDAPQKAGVTAIGSASHSYVELPSAKIANLVLFLTQIELILMSRLYFRRKPLWPR